MTLILYEDDANNGHPATENLRVTERLRRKDFGHMSVEVTWPCRSLSAGQRIARIHGHREQQGPRAPCRKV